MGSFFKLLPEILNSLEHAAEVSGLPIQLGEDEDSLFLRALVPGISKENLNIELLGQTVTISGAISPERGLYHRQERPAGRFCRKVNLGCGVLAAEAGADLRDGVLTLRLPKKDPGKACGLKRRIVCGSDT